MTAKPADSVKKYLPLFEKQKKKVVLDYGSGNLRNAMFFHRKGYQVFAVDLPHKIKYKPLPRLTCILPDDLACLDLKIDVVVCTFVLNLISSAERVKIFKAVAPKMTPGGYLLLEAKGLSLLELDSLVLPRGFIRISSQMGRYTRIALYQYIG